MTKGGLAALARAMSTDHAPLGIRVNVVSPGTIDRRCCTSSLPPNRPSAMRKPMMTCTRLGGLARLKSPVYSFFGIR